MEKKTLMLLGNGPTMRDGLRIARQEKMEIWGVNYQTHADLSLLFQMHGDHYIRARFLGHYYQMPPKCPIVMWHKWDELPTSVAFPVDDCVRFLGHDKLVKIRKEQAGPHDRGDYPVGMYTACTMAFMMALAMMLERYHTIYIYGVDFYHELKHEFTFERASFEYYMGQAVARGIKLVFPEQSRLMTTCDNLRQVYGIEWNPGLTQEEYTQAYRGVA